MDRIGHTSHSLRPTRAEGALGNRGAEPSEITEQAPAERSASAHQSKLIHKVFTGNKGFTPLPSEEELTQAGEAIDFFEKHFAHNGIPGFKNILAELKEKLAEGTLTLDDMADALEAWHTANAGEFNSSHDFRMSVLIGLLGEDPDGAKGEWAISYITSYLAAFGDDPDIANLLEKHTYALNSGTFSKTEFLNDLKSYQESHHPTAVQTEALDQAMDVLAPSEGGDAKIKDILDILDHLIKSNSDFKKLIEKFKDQIAKGTFHLKDCLTELKTFVQDHHLSGVVKIVLDKLLKLFGK